MNRLVSALAIFFPLVLGCNGRSPKPGFVTAPGSPFTVGWGPEDLAAGDVNNDRNLDIVTANGKSNDVTVLRGDGKGGFAPATGLPISVGKNPTQIAVGDVNNDGNLDLAIAYHDTYEITILLGNGNGQFKTSPGSPVIASDGKTPHTHGLALEDVNRDSKLDIITVNHADNNVSVLLGDGQGAFAPAPGSPFAVGKGPYPLAVGDVNRDSTLDIVTPNTGSGDLTVLLGDGRGDFRAAAGSPYSVKEWTRARPYYVVIGDLNEDDRPDLVTADNDSSLVTVLLADGLGGFLSAADSPLDLGNGVRAWGIVIADANADAQMDIVAATNKTVTVLLANSKGGFTPAAGSPFPVGAGAWKIVARDVNLDGKLDIVTNNSEGNTVTVLTGN